jgi:hypothetical protein
MQNDYYEQLSEYLNSYSITYSENKYKGIPKAKNIIPIIFIKNNIF